MKPSKGKVDKTLGKVNAVATVARLGQSENVMKDIGKAYRRFS
jgi:hypothetical protein